MALRRFGLALALFVVLAAPLTFAASRTAEAHAVLVRSTPEAEAQLQQAPASIDLWFSEPLEPSFSSFQLYASDGTELPVEGIRVDPTDAMHLSGLPRALPPGLYTVAYRTLSTRDGHEWTGSFAFTVLNPDGSVPQGSAFSPDVGGTNDAANVAGRWMSFVGLAIVAGGAALLLLVLRPFASHQPQATAPSVRLYRRLALAGLVLAATGGGLQLWDQHDALGGSLNTLLDETRFGTFWLVRQLSLLWVAMALVLLAIAQRRRRADAELPLIAASGAGGLAGLFALSMVSHAAAAPGSFWAVSFDFVHLAIAAAWSGGLIVLAALLVRMRQIRALAGREGFAIQLVGRFSVYAAIAIYVLAATGVFRAIGEMPTLDALTDTSWGQWLIIKLALLTPLLAVALLNRRLLAHTATGVLSPEGAARRLRLLLPAEAGLAVAVLFSVAVLGQEPTPRGTEVPTGAPPAPFSQVQQADELVAHLQITPNTVGENEYLVHLYGADGSDATGLSRVQFTFAPPEGESGGGVSVEPEPQGGGIFSTSGSYFSLPGGWQVRVLVQRSGADDVQASFDVPVEPGAAGDSGERSLFGSPAPQLSANAIAALALLAVGLAPVLWWRRIRQMGHAPSAAIFAVMTAVVLIGVTLGSSDPHSHPGSSLTNPNPGDSASITRGAQLFAANCAVCHGDTGRGDGPRAASLDPPPVPLTVHVPLHDDGTLFQFISDGVPGTAMPAWKESLTEQERWDLVNFLRSSFGARE